MYAVNEEFKINRHICFLHWSPLFLEQPQGPSITRLKIPHPPPTVFHIPQNLVVKLSKASCNMSTGGSFRRAGILVSLVGVCCSVSLTFGLTPAVSGDTNSTV
jgi:hypothetical protein